MKPFSTHLNICLSEKYFETLLFPTMLFSQIVLIEKSREKIFRTILLMQLDTNMLSYWVLSKREWRSVVFLVVAWLRTGNLKISGYVIASMNLGKSAKTSHYSGIVTMLWVSWRYWNGSFIMLSLYILVLLCKKYKKEEWWKQQLMEWMVSPQFSSQGRLPLSVIPRRIQRKKKTDYLSRNWTWVEQNK